jgi:hypothetical protein
MYPQAAHVQAPCPVLFSGALVVLVRPVAECEQRTPPVEIELSKPNPTGYVTERSGVSQCVTPPVHRYVQVRIASFGYVMRTEKRTCGAEVKGRPITGPPEHP